MEGMLKYGVEGARLFRGKKLVLRFSNIIEEGACALRYYS